MFSKESDERRLAVVIVRDRSSAGGGIFNYYDAIVKHLKVRIVFADVGRPHRFYGRRKSILSRFTALRLLCDWLALAFKIIWLQPDIVLVNPGLDTKTFRSLRRDAVNVRIAHVLRRRVMVFWRGWDNAWCGEPEFPGGNDGSLCRTYQRAEGHIVLAKEFEEDLRHWGFTAPIFMETTVASQEIIETSPASRTANEKPIHLLFLSRVEVAKGVFELLEAFLVLQKRAPGRFALTMAGDGPALEELRAKARELGIRDVNFTGFVEGEERIRCYRAASIFCFLSYTEGMPNAVLEAMGMGLPLISSDAGGLKDILEPGRTGFIVPQKRNAPSGQKFSAEEVAETIERLADDVDLRARISEHNRSYAKERFSARAVAARLEPNL